MLAVFCALGSALLYAMASVLQQRGAAAQPEEHSMRLGLLVRLAANPAWVVGVAADVGGYVLQFVALGNGPIVLVQPLLVSGLLFALPIGAALAARRLTARDWTAAVAVCAGLSVFLVVANPAAGRPNTTGGAWLAILLATSLLAAAAALAARRTDPRRRSLLLSAGAGVLYGATAGLTKTSAHLLGRGIPALFTHWEPYALVVAGVAGMLMSQSAFQAGALDISLPTMTVVDPVVSIAIGASAFGEALSSLPPAIAVEVLALALMAFGVFFLSRTEAANGVSQGAR